MRKFVALLTLSTMVLSACQSAPLTTSPTISQSPAQPDSPALSEATMEADFSWTPELAQAYLEQENVTQVSYSGPFYFGTFEGLDEYTKNYQKLRDQRSAEILAVVDQSVGYLNELDKKMRQIRGLFDGYFLAVSVLAPNAREELLQQIDQGNRMAVYNFQKLTLLNSLLEELAKMPKSAEWGFLSYTKYYLTFNLCESYQEELAFLYGRLAGLQMITDSYGLSQYDQFNRGLDAQLDPISLEVELLLRQLLYNGAVLAHQEKLLFTADHYYVRDVVKNIEEKLPELETAIDQYSGGKEEIAEDVLLVLSEQVAEYKAFAADMRVYLDSVPADELLADPELKTAGLIPVAHAGLMDTAKWFGGKIVDAGSAAANTAIDYGSAGVSMAWNGTKAVVNKGAEVAVSGVKLAGKGIGTVLDVASATAKTPMDVVNGVYYGNSAKQIASTIGSNYVQVYTNFQAGTQGHQVYQDTVQILDESDKVFAAGMEGLTKLIVGEGVTSKTVGFASKIVSGFFTGLGKDALIALNPNTSTADTLVSLLGVGLSCIGGSGSFLKGSQALKIGVTGAGRAAVSTGGNLIKALVSIDAAAIKGGITSFLNGGLKGAVKQLFSKQGAEMAFEGTKNILKNMKDKIAGGLDDAFNLLKSNASKNIPEAYSGLFEKKRMLSVFADVLGIGKSAGKGFAPKALSFLNNLVGSMADDKIKTWVGDTVKFLGVSGQTQEEINEEEVRQTLQAVQKAMQHQLSEQYNQEIKKLAEEYQQAKNEGTLGPWADLLISLLGVVSPGSYQAVINVQASQYGVTTSGGGPITFTIDQNFNLTCTSSLSTTASGSVQGMAVSGTATAEAVGCSGSINPETGEFKAGGSFQSTGTSTVSGYGASQSTSADMNTPFTASGTIKGNVINGSAQIGQFTFSISPASYSEI